jgi:hypothetical protein
LPEAFTNCTLCFFTKWLACIFGLENDGIAQGATRGAQLGRWGTGFNDGVDRMRRLVCEYYAGFSFGSFVRHHPDLRNTITDLLIGDLFTDRVDKVWAPMEALDQPGRQATPSWEQGLPPDQIPEKANALILPGSPRPHDAHGR